VTTWARRNQRHRTALTSLATANRWDIDPAATVAVGRTRSIYSHLPPGATRCGSASRMSAMPTQPQP